MIKKIGIGFSLIGLIDSLYLFILTRLEKPLMYCNISSLVNCSKVEFSQFSTFLGIPDALLGTIFFSIMLILWILMFTEELKYLWIVGSVFTIYLIYTEILIGNICLYCTIAHLSCLIQGFIIFHRS
ncbi:vitamin K epoxide reductase family protein [Saccharolobus solfataricus]|uniref:Vitamin K epoxide reductase domain-containing protein n=3 Tax=Saccharolobus solfataricus TaxID=2287 RepID=Q97X80_SACS2|nr:vitamin K epoxide reductase family protein [Saccharolobus solfataricus]AAK42062.1 Conserved hypothetical protein [Saccharolobus solfataricus P2]AKA74767.1 vitamin K epoxide reductase family protein [Saccharolobus solfataricus]AKA77463.1 vitamin K epoxide reductase family protein [Saccharolobus solfataricus]AKA80153.1 vitamin K epoxide reductase family protein [Saccharolobus solfataricus]AZF69233.1 vitamin K epoxide reductase family protein [Saccharolobus solfataricus]